MPTMPHLYFQGQCAEPMAHYADVLGGTGLQLMRYADGPGASPDWQASLRIMHAEITLGDAKLMASDYPSCIEGQPQAGFSVMHAPPDVEAAWRVFNSLATGGIVVDPFRATFFSPGFGMVKDRFGTHWIISAVPSA